MTSSEAGTRRGKLDGLIAAPFTPFDGAGRVNLPVVAHQVDLLVRSGVVGAFVSGTTGEGLSCSVAERKSVMEEWVRLARGRLFLIVHVGTQSLPEAIELAAHAQRVGADAIALVPPSFFKPSSVGALVDYVAAVVEGAPGMPFYYYHTTLSGVALPMTRFLEAAARRVPELAGLKFNDPDLHQFHNCLRACGGRFDVVWGIDEFYAGAVATGARAAIGSTYNYAAPLYHAVRRAVEAGRLAEAQAAMDKVCRIADILAEYGGVAAGKAMMAVHGIDVGDPRLPIARLTPAQKADIVARMREITGLKPRSTS